MCSALQEEELRKGGEPKYAHLAMELHVFIEVYAPIPEAYLRMAHAMEEVKKFLVPVSLNSGLVTPVYLMFAGFIGKKKTLSYQMDIPSNFIGYLFFFGL